jgi:hypothetical protein
LRNQRCQAECRKQEPGSSEELWIVVEHLYSGGQDMQQNPREANGANLASEYEEFGWPIQPSAFQNVDKGY